jgi:phage recombination protein Bet
MSNAIVKVQQMGLAVSEWPEEVWDVVKQQACPKGITDPEFLVFAAQCKARGLNPLAGEAYCVPRRTNVGGRDNPKWVTNHVFQASAEGMQARAARFPDFVKVDSAAVYERDPVVKIDTGRGQVEHVFDPTKPRGAFKGSWARVVKKDGSAVVVWLDAGDRTGNGTFWQQSMARMHEKCSRVAALRQAYPVAFAGTYAAEEMPPDTAPGESVLGQVLSQTPAASEPAPLPPVGPVVEFGEWKGRPVSGLSLDETISAIAFADAKLAEAKPGAKWVKKMEENRNVIEGHRFELETAAPKPAPDTVDAEFSEAPTENEPGSEG